MVSSQFFQSKLMCNYLSLQKVANLLIEIYSSLSKPKPLAICVQDNLTDKYVVIGAMPAHTTTVHRKK